MTHYLKIKAIYFLQILTGQKTFEVRSNIDRKYKVGDIAILREIDDYGYYTGRSIKVLITYILDDPYYCKENLVIWAFKIEDVDLKYDEV